MANNRFTLLMIGAALGVAVYGVRYYLNQPDTPEPPTSQTPTTPPSNAPVQAADTVLKKADQTDQATGRQRFEILSQEYVLDKPFMSMHGPHGLTPAFSLGEGDKTELLWVTGITTDVVDSRSLEPVSAEFMCHANLALNESFGAPRHRASFNNSTHMNRRMFTQVPGRLNLQFPEGFGIPLLSSEEMRYLTMAINLNHTGTTRRIRFKTDLHYIADKQQNTAMKPLFFRPLYVMQPVDLKMTREFEQRYNFNFKVCESCAPDRPVAASQNSIREDPSNTGQPVTVHWFVHPGKHVFRQRVTQQLELPFDTTVHYMTAHLHPKAKWIKLRDVTADEDVFISHSKDWLDKQGVAHMDDLQIADNSKKLFKDHDYELICEYENDTNFPVDAMAIMYLYMHDKDLKLPGK